MILGAMQPYLFPYLGYYQLMNSVDIYVFCGNIQYIRHGWINRNIIYIDKKQTRYFTFSVIGDDYKSNINRRYYSNLKADCNKLLRYIFQSYRRAVNFEEAYPVVEKALRFQEENVAYFNMYSNYIIAQYLGIEAFITCTDMIEDKNFQTNFCQLDRENRVIYLCNYFNAGTYINPIGGIDLYNKKFFAENDIKLQFLKMDDIQYMQFGNKFIPNLSIIDVIMHNKIDEIKVLLKMYQLI